MIFAFPSDLRTADTVSATGAGVEAAYPLTNLHDGKPTEICRFDDNIDTRIVWDTGGAAATLQGFMLIMHTFAAGTVLKLEANATDAWGAPSFTQNVTVPAWPDHLPANITVDLRGTLLASTGYRYRSLFIPAQTPDHAVGEVLWITQWRQTVKSPAWPMRRGDRRQMNVNRTSHGVEHVVERAVRQRRLRPQFPVILEADRALLLQLVRKANGAQSGWPVVINPDLFATEEHFYVRFHPDAAEEFEEELSLPGIHAVQMDLLEIQRGRAL